MKRFELTEDLITGMEDIDQDHRNIFEIGNRIINPKFIESDAAAIEETLSFLDDYVIYHFAAEEYAMYNTGYRGLENHSLRHKEFREIISDLIGKGRKEGISKEFVLKVSFALEKWFVEHIRVADRGFAQYLRKHKIQQTQLPGVERLKQAGKLPENFNEKIVPGR